MKKRLLIVLGLFSIFTISLLQSCNDEIAAGPGSSDSFIKLFGSENNQIANDMLAEASGDIVLLSTSNIEQEIGFTYKVKISKLDEFGNLLWDISYPTVDTISYKGSSITTISDGYLIIGESINGNNQSQLLILKLDATGSLIASRELAQNSGATPIRGIDLAINSSNEIKAIAQTGTNAETIWLGTLSNDNNLTLDSTCTFLYSSAGTNLEILKNSFIESNDDIVYGIGVFKTGRENGSLVKVPTCQPTLITGPLISSGQSSASYNVNQMSTSLNGYALVGTTNFNGDEDVFMARVDNSGVLIDSEPLIYGTLEGIVLDGNDEGLAIMQAGDGGFLIGGATESNSAGENDILLIKTDFTGNVSWVRQYGDENNDRPLVLKQATDGGYLILGNTDFGGIQSLLLIKTDKTGNVL